MSEFVKVSVEEDNDGHIYVIPFEMKDEFDRLLDGEEETEDEFNDTFAGYATGGCLSIVELYAKQDYHEAL